MTKHMIALAAAAIALQGCTTTPPSQTGLNLFNEGIAKTCTPSPVDLAATPATGTISMTNDGWCGVVAAEKDGKPYQLGLVRTRPEHGYVNIQRVNSQTRIEYTADKGYVGADRFTVALRSRTLNAPDTAVQVAVTVTMGESVAPLPAPAPAPAPTRRPATTRRTS